VHPGARYANKISPFTPYCGLKLGELAQQFFPPGVLQVISGDDSLGPQLTEHPDVDKISFTGSTATGKRVMQSAAGTLKRITLELGGNDPAIVCADVDIEATAAKVAFLAFANSGQICLALKRIYIQDTIFNEFRDAMVKNVKALQLGSGLEKTTTHGPIQNAMQYERVQGFFADIESEKWNVAVGGVNDPKSKGYFIQPTIIDNPAEDSRIVVEEPFGKSIISRYFPDYFCISRITY
jgi:acyl-CoA reductase-like NAD-dependent aldehyde dehydrogenase